MERYLISEKEVSAPVLQENRFLSQLEQELRTAVHALSGTTQILMKTESRQSHSPKEWREHVENLNDINQEFVRLLDQLHDYQAVGDGDLNFQIHPIDLPQLLNQFIRLFLPRAKEKGVELLLDYLPEASTLVYGDAVRIRQIIYNLLETALRLTETGKITVTVEPSVESSAVRISISDTSEGFTAAQLQQLNQGNEKNVPRDFPLGLGFSLLKHLVAGQGGTLHIESRVNVGTTVTFTLPTQVATYDALHVLSPLPIWIVMPEEDDVVLLEELQTAGLNCISTRLDKAMFDLSQCAAAALPRIILVKTKALDQQVAYFARTLRANRQYGKIFLAVVLPLSANYDYDKEQALINGYDVVIHYSRYELFLEALATAWRRWQKKMEEVMMKRTKTISKVLVVEDNIINQKVIRVLLKELGVQAEIVSTGKKGLDAINKSDYAALFVDLGLPDIPGLEFIQHLRRRDDEKRLWPVIVLSADSRHEKNHQGQGIDAYLVKPLTLKQLKETLTPFFPQVAAA